MSLSAIDPPSAKLPAPVAAAAMDLIVDDEVATSVTPPAAAVAPEPAPSRYAATPLVPSPTSFLANEAPADAVPAPDTAPASELIVDVSVAASPTPVLARKVPAVVLSMLRAPNASTVLSIMLIEAAPASAALPAPAPAAEADLMVPPDVADRSIRPAVDSTDAPRTYALTALPMSFQASAAPAETLPEPATEPARESIADTSFAVSVIDPGVVSTEPPST